MTKTAISGCSPFRQIVGPPFLASNPAPSDLIHGTSVCGDWCSPTPQRWNICSPFTLKAATKQGEWILVEFIVIHDRIQKRCRRWGICARGVDAEAQPESKSRRISQQSPKNSSFAALIQATLTLNGNAVISTQPNYGLDSASNFSELFITKLRIEQYIEPQRAVHHQSSELIQYLPSPGKVIKLIAPRQVSLYSGNCYR